MKPSQPDDDLDRILEVLRASAPAPGMESRILHALQTQSSMPPTRRWLGVPALPLFASAAAAMLVLAVASRFHQEKPRGIAIAAQISPLVSDLAVRAPVAIAPFVAHQPAPVLTAVARQQPEPVSELSHPELNLPAPPMPLTAQERLLLRVAQRGHPQAFATLNSEVAELRQARDLAAFDALFQQILLPAFNPAAAQPAPDPPAPDQPTSTDSTNPINSGDDPWQPAARN